MGTARPIKHPMPGRVKPSFVIFDIRALWRSLLSVRVPGCQKLQMMLYSCTHVAPLGVKGLTSWIVSRWHLGLNFL